MNGPVLPSAITFDPELIERCAPMSRRTDSCRAHYAPVRHGASSPASPAGSESTTVRQAGEEAPSPLARPNRLLVWAAVAGVAPYAVFAVWIIAKVLGGQP